MFRNTALLLILLLLGSCGGRIAQPTAITYAEDHLKPCHVLDDEMSLILAEINRLIPMRDKNNRNAVVAASAFITPYTLLLIDVSHAEEREITALKERYNHLLKMSETKKFYLDKDYLKIVRREFLED